MLKSICSSIVGVMLTLCIAVPGHAATVSTWSGPGPHACHDACPMRWAETQLTDDERAELHKVQKTQPEPAYIEVTDGQVFRLMAYQREGKPLAYRTTTIAVLDAPSGSWGWQMPGWAFVRLVACGNPAIVTDTHVGGSAVMGDPTLTQGGPGGGLVGYPATTLGAAGNGLISSPASSSGQMFGSDPAAPGDFLVPVDLTAVADQPDIMAPPIMAPPSPLQVIVPPSPVSLPSGGVLLLCAVVGLVLRKGRMQR